MTEVPEDWKATQAFLNELHRDVKKFKPLVKGLIDSPTPDQLTILAQFSQTTPEAEAYRKVSKAIGSTSDYLISLVGVHTLSGELEQHLSKPKATPSRGQSA